MSQLLIAGRCLVCCANLIVSCSRQNAKPNADHRQIVLVFLSLFIRSVSVSRLALRTVHPNGKPKKPSGMVMMPIISSKIRLCAWSAIDEFFKHCCPNGPKRIRRRGNSGKRLKPFRQHLNLVVDPGNQQNNRLEDSGCRLALFWRKQWKNRRHQTDSYKGKTRDEHSH